MKSGGCRKFKRTKLNGGFSNSGIVIIRQFTPLKMAICVTRQIVARQFATFSTSEFVIKIASLFKAPLGDRVLISISFLVPPQSFVAAFFYPAFYYSKRLRLNVKEIL